jgi:regulator of cell morphogenesis and NO signaling
VPLPEAAAAKGLPLSELESELAAAAALALPAERPEAMDDLITMIETRFHADHRRDLPEIIRLARRVEAVHKDHPAVPRGLAARLETIEAELEEHMQKEEQVLFPMMRQGGHPMIAQPIQVLLSEHDNHGVHLRELERLTDTFTVPDDACPTWCALYAGAQKFADDLVDHINIENNVLFPRFTT